MPPTLELEPAKVAYYEKAGWEAYYDRNWPRAFWLLVQLNRAEFRMGWPLALAAALDTVRASIAFAPLDRSDVPKATAYIQKFYEKAARSLKMPATRSSLSMMATAPTCLSSIMRTASAALASRETAAASLSHNSRTLIDTSPSLGWFEIPAL